MSDAKKLILVFGATGQQGGSVADAALEAGWAVRALVRDPTSAKASALARAGIELAKGDFTDVESIRAALKDVYGVFSVQPSSGQGPTDGISDEEEIRYGTTIANLAGERGVAHFIYSSIGAVGEKPTGMGHFDSKALIEAHIRGLSIAATIIRPAAFMEMLLMPGFGLDEGRFSFFMKRDQSMQLLAVEDLGKFVAAIFADPARFVGKTLDVASDSVTGGDLEIALTQAAGRDIHYTRFSDEVLESNPFLAKLTALLDDGALAGHADLGALHKINPEMYSFRSWLASSGRAAFEKALGTPGAWSYGNA